MWCLHTLKSSRTKNARINSHGESFVAERKEGSSVIERRSDKLSL